jgi:protein-S-isoprenylcysteine O-methyltransferase Ste14
VSFRTHAAVLFRIRGWVLGAAGLFALTAASPRLGMLLTGLAVVFLGCALRCWAFSHLGSQGRTRDPTAPAQRVVTGPYRSVAHPVYLSNLLIAIGLLLSASPPVVVATPLLVTVVLLYGILARRENRQLRELCEVIGGKRMGWAEVARSERSTWLQLALFQVCVGLQL